ncbi:alpha/beta fold hydrolase (plasmid) [Pseudoalteromonas sp. T1lg65]|uniref:alpha/beta fold hydrolase n=1 Tax=Pseudoalteromonas sp. T1lg65 TaxID=2077101 RepID=UPI003F793EA0
MMKNIYFLPGTQCNEQLWELMTAYFPSDITPHFLTIPQHQTPRQISAHLNEILPSQTVNLVGFSLGGYLAAHFACQYPKRVDRLFVIANCPTELPEREIKRREDQLELIHHYSYRGMSTQAAKALLDKHNHSAELISRILEMDKQQGEEDLVSQYHYTTEREDLLPKLSGLTIPTHFYFSEHDPLVNSWLIKDLATKNPNIVANSESGCGHMLPLEHPQKLARALLTWLART